MCKLLQTLTSAKASWIWNRMYQDLYDRAKKIIKKEEEACIRFYHTYRALYLETDASGISLGTSLLQVRDDINCGHGEVLDNATLYPIALARKN